MFRRLFRKILPAQVYWRLRKAYVALARRATASEVPSDASRLIIFLVPGINHPGGGILSIASLLQETRQLKDVHDGDAIWCVIPGDPPLFKYSWFKNRLPLHDFETTLRNAKKLQFLLLHLPENSVNRTTEWLLQHRSLIDRIPQRHFNVMLQNIDQLEGQKIDMLSQFGKVTCTTAHEAYTTDAVRQRLGVPLHKMSVFISPEQYERKHYDQKENLLLYSPDEHPMKHQVLAAIKDEHPDLKLRMIRDLTYEEFKRLISRAKWSLTFGEGLDGYFAEPVFSGTVSFAVFNNRFFTPEFAALPTIYSSWNELELRIADDIKHCDETSVYFDCWKRAFDLLTDLYDVRRYRENLRQFYLGNYTFP